MKPPVVTYRVTEYAHCVCVLPQETQAVITWVAMGHGETATD